MQACKTPDNALVPNKFVRQTSERAVSTDISSSRLVCCLHFVDVMSCANMNSVTALKGRGAFKAQECICN